MITIAACEASLNWHFLVTVLALWMFCIMVLMLEGLDSRGTDRRPELPVSCQRFHRASWNAAVHHVMLHRVLKTFSVCITSMVSLSQLTILQQY